MKAIPLKRGMDMTLTLTWRWSLPRAVWGVSQQWAPPSDKQLGDAVKTHSADNRGTGRSIRSWRGERLGGVEDSSGRSKQPSKWAAYPQPMEEIPPSINADLFILDRSLSLKPSHSHESLQLALSPPISLPFSLFLEKTTLRKIGWKNMVFRIFSPPDIPREPVWLSHLKVES